MTAPERVARAVVLLLANVAAFAPLALQSAGPRGRGLANPVIGALLLLLAWGHALGAESTPEDLDSDAARRARRFAPFAVGLLLSGVPTFPWLFGWEWLTVLFFANLPLVAFWFVPGVRAVSLVVVTTVALASVVLVPGDRAWPCLLPVGLAWALVPALDRLVAVRAQLDPRPAARLGPALAPAAAVLTLGLALGLAAAWALPPSTRAWADADLLRPGAPSTRLPPPTVPIGTLALLAGSLAAGVALWSAYSERRGGRLSAPTERGVMSADAPRPLDPEAVERGVDRWPAGPRRDLVLGYLRHLIALDGRGLGRPPGRTPAEHARALGGRVAAAAAAAARLADLFGRARWSSGPVTPADAARAKEDVAAVEAAAEAARPGRG